MDLNPLNTLVKFLFLFYTVATMEVTTRSRYDLDVSQQRSQNF